ncbi:MAG: DUF6580 family putative transport protein [Candidatus Shapirobacteria bacterium]|jgi:hypothetical protein
MKKLINPIFIILLAVIIRLVPHPPNMAPIAAMALFGGAYFSKKYALIVPIIVLFVSDLFLGFHNTIPFVYGSFLLTGIIGLWLKNHKNFKYLVVGTLLSSVLFFLITNFGVWMMGTMYIKNFNGLMQSYIMAIPFFRNTIVGDLLYTGLFFGGYKFVLRLSQKTAVKFA